MPKAKFLGMGGFTPVAELLRCMFELGGDFYRLRTVLEGIEETLAADARRFIWALYSMSGFAELF